MHVHGQIDGLLRSQLGDQNVRVDGHDGVLVREVLGLSARGLEDNVPGVDVRVVVRLQGIRLGWVGIPVHGAGDVQLQADRVPVEAVGVGILARLGLLVPLEEVVQPLLAALEGDEAQPVRQDLILDDGGVVLDVDVLDGEGRDLGEQDATEGVGQRGVDADEGEGGVEGVVLVKVDAEAVAEAIEGEGVVLAGEVAGEVDGCCVKDCFFADTDGLRGRVSSAVTEAPERN